ncbi:MAG: M20/M25/M40 family metallo-hydrolase, partial [Pirellulaceae bacterium]|nr:M20/M25/M40 family metallo-hydrolase [Pirellulaceae bacterium]
MTRRSILSTFALILAATTTVVAEERNNEESEQRLLDSVKYLSSDELGGRGVGTPGIDKAAEYIAGEFAKAGLNIKVFDGQPYQKFTINLGAKYGPEKQNRLAFEGPEKDGKPQTKSLKLKSQFSPLALGSSQAVSGELVFVGYGITAKDPAYDDYADIDVKGKVVLMLRKEPQQGNPHSGFAGLNASRHATFRSKVLNAVKHGAAAVIMVNDNYGAVINQGKAESSWKKAVAEFKGVADELAAADSPSKELRDKVGKAAERIKALGDSLDGDFDQIITLNEAGGGSITKKAPVFFAKRSEIDAIVTASLGKSLVELEAAIDKDLKPVSGLISDWKVTCEANIRIEKTGAKNVVGVLEGEGPLADETIVVGAHYDHLGMGGAGSLAPWTKEIHNGADDNASGSSALLEVARYFGSRQEKPSRRLVFIAFSGEERGLLGSAYYVANPRFALEDTVAMVNMDMVGRLADHKLIVHGTGTATQFDPLVDELNELHKFTITKKPSGFGPSDHTSFYTKKIPVLHIFTGTHKDYHRPSDDYEKVNVKGM